MLGIKPTTNFDLPWYDYTTLNTIEICPRKGLIQYINNKHVNEHEPSDALLAGNAAHRFFAAYNSYNTDLNVFSSVETEQMDIAAANAGTFNQARLAYAIEAIYLSDLPEGMARKNPDKIEKSCLFWADQQNHGHKVIAVEYPFDITINDSFRYVGVIDCIQLTKEGLIIPVEYKTTSNINDGYLSQWFMNHQITGYHIAARCLFEHKQDVFNQGNALADYVVLEAVQLPIPKTNRSGNPHHVREAYKRTETHYKAWSEWVSDNTHINHDWCEDPWIAPIRTHSCFSYFTTCQFIDFCQQSETDRKEIFENELVTQVWDPTDNG